MRGLLSYTGVGSHLSKLAGLLVEPADPSCGPGVCVSGAVRMSTAECCFVRNALLVGQEDKLQADDASQHRGRCRWCRCCSCEGSCRVCGEFHPATRCRLATACPCSRLNSCRHGAGVVRHAHTNVLSGGQSPGVGRTYHHRKLPLPTTLS